MPDEVAAVDAAPIQISNVKVRKDYNPKGLLKCEVQSVNQFLFNRLSGLSCNMDILLVVNENRTKLFSCK